MRTRLNALVKSSMALTDTLASSLKATWFVILAGNQQDPKHNARVCKRFQHGRAPQAALKLIIALYMTF